MSARRRSLGRGLDSLLGDEAPPAVRELPVAELKPNRFQPRSYFDEDKLDELAASIKAQGIVQPIVVTPDDQGGFSILAGERRWRASQRAGLKSVPVVVRSVSGDQERLELALVENVQRSDLNPVEEAEAFDMLRESFGLSQDDIAKRVGRNRSTVSNTLRLLNLPGEILDLLRESRITAGQARPLLTLTDRNRQVTLAERVVEEALSAREVERLVSELKESGTPEKPKTKKKTVKPKEVHTAAAEESLIQRLQTKVEIRRRGRGGMLCLHFHSEDELIRLYDILMDRGNGQ